MCCVLCLRLNLLNPLILLNHLNPYSSKHIFLYSKLQLAKKYFHYYITASNGKGHGVHSPFVFDFIKHVLNDKTPYGCYKKIEAIRKALLQNHGTITVQDFGAGSTVIKSDERVIAKMAQSSLKPKKFAQLLYRIVAYYQPTTLIELGTSFGITSAYLASANAAAKLYTCEGAPGVARIAQDNFDTLQLSNIIMVEGDFNRTLPALLYGLKQIDFAFVDGNHRKSSTLDYFEQLLQHSGNDSIFIFDDIHWSAEMEVAWSDIKKHPSVTQTIDLFFIGIVFFNADFVTRLHHVVRF